MITEGGLVNIIIRKIERCDLNANQSDFNYHGAE